MISDDVKTIVDNIEDFIELPGGIDRLRKMMISLAVSGKLIRQDPTEGTAEDLYFDIQKKLLTTNVGASEKKKNHKSSTIPSGNTPFEIPKSWKWVRVREIARDCGQKVPDKEFCYVDVSSINSAKGVISSPKRLTASEAPSRARKRVQNGSVLYSGVRPYLLNTAVVDLSRYEEEVIVSTAFFVLQPYADISSEYVHLVIRSPYFDEMANKASVGAAYPAINADRFQELPLPLPPVAEQKRIVSEVNQIMSLLDSLAVKKSERDYARKSLTRSAMHSLGFGDADIALKNLEELVKTSGDLKELEKSILTLAFSGKLVSQLATDGNAADLFDEIKQKQHIGQVKKKRAALSPVTDEECPFDIPKTWKWIRLGECISISSGDLLRVSDANHGEYLVYGGNGIAGRHTAFNAKKGTIVIGRVGALCGVAHITETDAWVTDNAFIVNYPEEFLDKNFFKLLLNHLNLRQAHRGSAQPVISGISVYPMLMPLPPLREQKRISEKVEKVMDLVRCLHPLLVK